MIGTDKRLRRVCRNYHLVENYEKAIADKEELWVLHHRKETDEMKSMQQLKDEMMYYDVEPSELIFLTEAEHTRLHHKGKFVSEETRKKLKENHQDMSGEKNPFYGKRHSEEVRKRLSETHKGNEPWNKGKHDVYTEETRKKISEAAKKRTGINNGMFGIKHSEESRKKMSNNRQGFLWWNNSVVSKLCKEQPGPDFVRGRLQIK